MEINFYGKKVGIVGYSSLNADYNLAVARIIELEGGKVVGDFCDDENLEDMRLVLIGDMDFDEDFLIKSIKVGIQNDFTCEYLSLEDFWDYYDDSYPFEPYFENDPRIERHAGLSFLASLYFKFPTVDILGFPNKHSGNSNGWNQKSILMENFGYSVEKGISKRERRVALENAVRSPELITLREIAEHIVLHINLRKGQQNMVSAVMRWMEDLEWLKERYYNPSVHSFKFPTPD